MQPDKNSRKPNHLSVHRSLAMGAIAAAVFGTLVGWGGEQGTRLCPLGDDRLRK